MKNSDELQLRLNHLRTELNETGELDEISRQKLQALVADVERGVVHLKQQEATAEATAAPLRERIAAAMTDFEVEHPRLSASLSQLVDQLAMMGI